MSAWIRSFSDKELFAPFTVKNDCDYYDDLRKRYTHFVKLLTNAKADDESLKIAKKYTDKVCEALRSYYKGNISSCHQIIGNLVSGCSDNELAVSLLNNSRAFPGQKGSEVQFFRARAESEAKKLLPRVCFLIQIIHIIKREESEYNQDGRKRGTEMLAYQTG